VISRYDFSNMQTTQMSITDTNCQIASFVRYSSVNIGVFLCHFQVNEVLILDLLFLRVVPDREGYQWHFCGIGKVFNSCFVL
jgi:hypothetical protein